MQLSLERPLAIFDLEATGINIAKDRIVEIFILKVNPDGSEEKFHSRINPRIPIPPEVTEIHGISDADVADKPTFLTIAFEIKDFLENCDLAGYNSNRYDIPLLLEEFYRIGVNLDLNSRKLVDIFTIFVKMEGRDLSSAYKFYCDKELKNAHSAEADVRATYEVLKGQLARYPEALKNEMSFLHEFTHDGKFIDSGRRLIWDKDVAKFNFGKHKDKTVEEVLEKEPQYYDWIMRSDFLQDTKQKLTEIRNSILDKKKADKEENAQNTGGDDDKPKPPKPPSQTSLF